ncbi:MAG: hypothetical protein O2809_00875 [Proteobacteria bacterium]|nr:hypothetical protein [Pseudomonadota bacterium]
MRHLLIKLTTLSLIANQALAYDLGVHGTTFPIKEINLKDVIVQQGSAVDWDAVGNKIKKSAHGYLDDLPNQTSTINTENKTVYYDPSIKMNRDIYTSSGQLLYKKDTWFNPLWKTRQIWAPNMLVIDGEDKAQVKFALAALKQHRNDLEIVFTNGKPTELAKKINVPVYYANAPMVKQFHIHSVPTMIGLGVGDHYYDLMQMQFSEPYYLGLIDKCWHGCTDKVIQSYIQTHANKGDDHV